MYEYVAAIHADTAHTPAVGRRVGWACGPKTQTHTHTLIHINENTGKGYFKVDGQRGEQNKYALRKRTVYFTTRRNI